MVHPHVAVLAESVGNVLGRAADAPVTELIYVGDPDWELGDWCISGPPDHIADRLREYGDMGVDHIQIRFRNRSLDELLDQMDAFGAEVAPLLGS